MVLSSICVKIIRLQIQNRGKIIMAEKKLTDLKEFIESVNKKNKKHNGKVIQFAFVNKKRKN